MNHRHILKPLGHISDTHQKITAQLGFTLEINFDTIQYIFACRLVCFFDEFGFGIQQMKWEAIIRV